MKFEKKHYVGIIVGIILAILSFILLANSRWLYFLWVVSFIIIALPFMLSAVSRQNRQKERESKFLEFSRDLVEASKTGTPVVRGIIHLKNRNYGSLSPHIQKLANQLVLGISLRDAFAIFAQETNSPVISRSVDLISEAERAGGNIATVLESVVKSVDQVETLKKQQKSSVSSLVNQGYLIFMIFIIIMLVLEFRILPLVYDLSSVEGLSISAGTLDPGDFSFPLFLMIVVQSFFAGLVIGKVSEGKIRVGIRHSFILLVITLLVTTGSKALFGVPGVG